MLKWQCLKPLPLGAEYETELCFPTKMFMMQKL